MVNLLLPRCHQGEREREKGRREEGRGGGEDGVLSLRLH